MSGPSEQFFAIVRRLGATYGIARSSHELEAREPWSAWLVWGDCPSERVTARGQSPSEACERLDRLIVARFGSTPPSAP